MEVNRIGATSCGMLRSFLYYDLLLRGGGGGILENEVFLAILYDGLNDHDDDDDALNSRSTV